MPIHPGQDKTIGRLMEGIHRGEFVIPYFQRDFEWTPNMVKDLLSSIVSGYFVGLLLFWELDSEIAGKEKWQEVWGSHVGENVNFAVLDGQQRLSSLYYALYNPNKPFPFHQSYFTFYLNIQKYYEENYDESVITRFKAEYSTIADFKKRKKQFVKEMIFPLALLSDDNFREKELKQWMQEYAERISEEQIPLDKFKNKTLAYTNAIVELRQRLDAIEGKFLNYQCTTHVLSKDKDVKDICLIFAKLNQKGLKLSTFDLMNAFLYPKGVSLKESYKELQRENKKLASVPGIEELILKTMALHKREYSTPKYIYTLVPGEKVKIGRGEEAQVVVPVKDAKEFESLWTNSLKFCELARKRISNVSDRSFGSIKIDFIPNTTIISVLGAVLWYHNEGYKTEIPENKLDDILTKWYWSATLSGDYSGSSDSEISKDYRDFKRWFRDGIIVDRVTDAFIERVFSELDISKAQKDSSLYNAIISIIALNKAQDFFELTEPGSVDYSESNINDHHIFPDQVKGLDPHKSQTFGKTKDFIVNRTLLFNSTNIKIGNKKPSQYIQEMLTDLGGDRAKLIAILSRHLISEEALNRMEIDDYDDFIIEREKSIRAQMGELLGIKQAMLA